MAAKKGLSMLGKILPRQSCYTECPPGRYKFVLHEPKLDYKDIEVGLPKIKVTIPCEIVHKIGDNNSFDEADKYKIVGCWENIFRVCSNPVSYELSPTNRLARLLKFFGGWDDDGGHDWACLEGKTVVGLVGIGKGRQLSKVTCFFLDGNEGE